MTCLTPTLAAYLHQIDPVAFHIPGLGLAVRWYGLSYLLAFLIGYALVLRVAKVGICSLAPAKVGDLILTLALGIVVGGRLGYIAFYRPDLLWTFTPGPPWWGAIAINHGGMASHGGMIGGVVAALLFAHRHGQRPLFLFDLFAFGAPLGLFFGRIANFINGELIGRPCAPGFPLAVKFPQGIYDWPQDKIDTLATRLRALGVDPWATTTGGMRDGTSWVVHQVQQHNQQVIDVLRPMLTPRHPSQLYAAVGEGLVVFAVVLVAWARPRKPGTIGGVFGIAYAVVRIVDEFWRRPDVFLMNDEFAWTGISRGQWLSVGLLLLSVGVLVIAQRRENPKMGSWVWQPGRVEENHQDTKDTEGTKTAPHADAPPSSSDISAK